MGTGEGTGVAHIQLEQFADNLPKKVVGRNGGKQFYSNKVVGRNGGKQFYSNGSISVFAAWRKSIGHYKHNLAEIPTDFWV